MAISKALAASVLLAASLSAPILGFVTPPPSPGAFSATATTSYPQSLALASASDDETSAKSSSSSSETLTLFSPCKINLFLRIIRKREDGFHDLASLFQAVGFGDTLKLSLLPPSKDDDSDDDSDDGDSDDSDSNDSGDVFSCNMAGVPTDSSNLVLRALELMRTKTGLLDARFDAALHKRVPAQAGLGGGSANAAAAMWGANELLGKPATLDDLVEWSGELGSDITFFLSRGTAYCTGRGEVMTPCDPPLRAGGQRLSIVKPDLGLSTPRVFKALDYEQLSERDPEELRDAFLEEGVNEIDDGCYVNDLEQPAFDCLPELKALKEELLKVEGFDHVMMSGSGTSIFCIGEPEDPEAFMKEFDGRDGLSVFNSEFIGREEGRWFEDPNGN